MTTTPEWISIVAPFASGALGVGIAWGVIRQRVIDLDRRVGNTERKLDLQVGDMRCKQMRDECKKGMSDIVGEIKAEIINNRNWVTDRFTEIARFMGQHESGP